MNSIDQMVCTQPWTTPQVTGALTQSRFWAATVFLDHYSNYYYNHLIRGTSADKTLLSKEYYEHL